MEYYKIGKILELKGLYDELINIILDFHGIDNYCIYDKYDKIYVSNKGGYSYLYCSHCDQLIDESHIRRHIKSYKHLYGKEKRKNNKKYNVYGMIGYIKLLFNT